MKRKEKFFIPVIAILLIVIQLYHLVPMTIYAHSAMLETSYDTCDYNKSGDGIDEVWYILETPTLQWHLSHEEDTIKFYFEEISHDGNYSWTTVTLPYISEETAEEIKAAYAESMMKWNNVYFYICDSNGNVEKKKIINVLEGTEDDHNLSIYPAMSDGSYVAQTMTNGSKETIESGTITHYHYSDWKMLVYVEEFFVHGNYTDTYVDTVRNRTGAHELGHILGLLDVDKYCQNTTADNHHAELLMGYGLPMETRSCDITYKDIAGVAITRGFHTDSDHKWLYAGQQSDGTYKLICSICNGVKYVESLSGYAYNTYNACGENHTLSSGNMMAVASYGTSDYYKCKYCRYVAPFENIVAQNYSIAQYNSALHKYTNSVNGLEYTFYEEHSFNYGNISDSSHTATCACGYTVTQNHVFTYESISNLYHISVCACGYTTTGMHTTRMIDNRYSACTICGEVFDSWSDNIIFKAEEDMPQE